MPKTKFLGAIVEGLSDSDEEKFMSVLNGVASKMGVTVSGSVGLYKGEKVAKKSREDQKGKGWYQAMKDGHVATKKAKGHSQPVIQTRRKSNQAVLEEAAPKETVGKKTSKKKVRVLSEDERKTINW